MDDKERMISDKYSIYIKYPSGEKFYTGKVIGNTFYRNLKLNHAVLWSDREFGINIEIFDYLKEKGVKYIIYIDTAKRDEFYKISLEKFEKNKLMKEFKFGRQYFVKVDAATKIKKVPNLPYVSRLVIIESK